MIGLEMFESAVELRLEGHLCKDPILLLPDGHNYLRSFDVVLVEVDVQIRIRHVEFYMLSQPPSTKMVCPVT
jgi:hypothetical protein